MGDPPQPGTGGNEVYSPTDDEIALAERNLAAYLKAATQGRGAVGVEGVLVDAANVKMAEQTLARVALIKGRQPADAGR